MYTILEMHVNLDLEGFEDVGEDGEPTGINYLTLLQLMN